MYIALCILYILSIVFLLTEWWCLKHTYTWYRASLANNHHWEKYDTKVLNLVGLVGANLIPAINVVYFIAFWLILYVPDECPSYKHCIKLLPPEELEEEVKISKLDKWLNKSI